MQLGLKLSETSEHAIKLNLMTVTYVQGYVDKDKFLDSVDVAFQSLLQSTFDKILRLTKGW